MTYDAYHQHLLAWYDAHGRALPWRAPPGHTPNPYHVWLSEMMLQQTTVPAVKSYFLHFITQWPTLPDLARASLDAILHAWQGLGYYARARNLHKAAQEMVLHHQGQVPRDLKTLESLPGIGPYTAKAILSIAYDIPAPVLEANIKRIMARLFQLENAQKDLEEKALLLTPSQRPGDYAQALMDLGSTVCTSQQPGCPLCPIQTWCGAYNAGTTDLYPRPKVMPVRPRRYQGVYCLQNGDQQWLIRKRPPKGLLGGLLEFPMGEKVPAEMPEPDEGWKPLPPKVQHTFTHFHLELEIFVGRIKNPGALPPESFWCAPEDLKDHAFPTLMRKVMKVLQP